MNLLPKQTIPKVLAQERNTEIQQGVTLARRVDALRALSKEEERKLNEYRDATLASITQDIAELEKKRGDIESYLKSTQDKANAILPALEVREKNIAQREEELQHLKAEYEKLKMDEYEINGLISEKLQELNDSVIRQKTQEQIAKEAAQNARIKERQIEQSALERQKSLDKISSDAKKTLLALEEREQIIALREQRAAEKEKENMEKEHALNDEKNRIARMRGFIK